MKINILIAEACMARVKSKFLVLKRLRIAGAERGGNKNIYSYLIKNNLDCGQEAELKAIIITFKKESGLRDLARGRLMNVHSCFENES